MAVVYLLAGRYSLLFSSIGSAVLETSPTPLPMSLHSFAYTQQRPLTFFGLHSLQVEKFNSAGQYLDSEVTFTVCLSRRLGDTQSMVLVYRRGIDETVFTEVTSVVASDTKAGCFIVRSKTSTFIFADVSADWNSPQYVTHKSSSEAFVVSTLEQFDCSRTLKGGTGVNCDQRICPYVDLRARTGIRLSQLQACVGCGGRAAVVVAFGV